MKRRLFNILSAVSLMLFVVLAVVRWYCTSVGSMLPLVKQPGDGKQGAAFTDQGCFVEYIVGPVKSAVVSPTESIRVGSDMDYNLLGFELARRVDLVTSTSGSTTTYYYVVVAPYWLLLLPSLILPACWLQRWRKERARSRQQTQLLCLHCGYDLRANKERCPECGTPIPAGGVNDKATARPGSAATVIDNGATVIGNGATVTRNDANFIGNSATVIGDGATVIGNGATVIRNGATVIGNGAAGGTSRAGGRRF